MYFKQVIFTNKLKSKSDFDQEKSMSLIIASYVTNKF